MVTARFSLTNPRQTVLAITPFEIPDFSLVKRLGEVGFPVVDLGHDYQTARQTLELLEDQEVAFGVRFSDEAFIDDLVLPTAAKVVVLPRPMSKHPFKERWVLVQVVSLDEAQQACKFNNCDGLIAKGWESPGRVGEVTSFVLLQQLVNRFELPIWVQGGIGKHTAAAAICGGASGVVLDCQLTCMEDSSFSDAVKTAVAKLDGSESLVVNGYRVIVPRWTAVSELAQLSQQKFRKLLGKDPTHDLIPAGQDIAFSGMLAESYKTTRGLVEAIIDGIDTHVRLAQTLDPLGPQSQWAHAHGVTYPVVQGPMSCVSDRARFAQAVSLAGGLPVLGLAMVRGKSLEKMLTETAQLLGHRHWGVGILGFAPSEVRREQMSFIERFRPSVAIIAGGRPSVARPLEDLGIATYLHVPSRTLLDMFLKEGARRFVFEGCESGGHIGPRSSFVLWEEQIERLMGFDTAFELSVLFAGGIHDARSAAMVSAMAASLAARGAKIGIIMGTAYLFTEEAVSSGAILPGFQQAVIKCEKTVVLETAPGHASRCVASEYVDTFIQKRAQLLADGKESQMIWRQLEELNRGRLRIASKGKKQISTCSANYTFVDEKTQRKEGLFLAGQVSTLRNVPCRIEELHYDVSVSQAAHLKQVKKVVREKSVNLMEKVAIVGMDCIYAGSGDLEAFWSNIVEAENTITEVPKDRWNPEVYYDPAATDSAYRGRKTPSKWGGFISAIDFDPVTMGMPPRTVAAIEPVQLLALEVSHRALADAGYSTRGFGKERTAVIFGATMCSDISAAHGLRTLYPKYLGELPEELNRVLPEVTEDTFPGLMANVISGRIANRLDLGGVNYTVDAACASSLAAVYAACQELALGSSDMVLCGGADLHNSINDFLMFSSLGVLSPKGQCRAFDEQADGIVLGEGVAVLVLKRLADAQESGDRIYAVIDGISGTSDGKSDGLTVPDKESQKRVMRRTYAMSGTWPHEIGLVEAHGTGTVIGDRIELTSLTDVYTADGINPGQIILGSVKSQIGHTKCAAGLAGMIKAVKALYHKTLPPTLHLTKPNPAYDIATSPFSFLDSCKPWLADQYKAAVSASGFGGANFHAVLSGNPDEGQQALGLVHWPAELFLFRGKDAQEARTTILLLLKILEQQPPCKLRDLAHAVAGRYKQREVHLAIVSRSFAELKRQLQAVTEDEENIRGVFERGQVEGKVAFLFPGQGSQRTGMLSELFVTFPELRKLLKMGAPWLDKIYPIRAFDAITRKRQTEALNQTEVAQPAMGMVDLAIAQLLEKFGVRPDMLAGHSYGELVALCVAGVIEVEELLPLSQARAQAIISATDKEKGAMLAVRASANMVERLLKEADASGRVVLANQNAPNQSVISGPLKEIGEVRRALTQVGLSVREIPVSCAFHSPLVSKGVETFAACLKDVSVSAPRCPVFSNSTAEAYTDDPQVIRKQLAEHIASPVRFVDQIEAMHSAGARIFVEVGPGSVLSGLAQVILKGKPHLTVSTNEVGRQGIQALLEALAALAVNRVDFSAEALFEGRISSPFVLENPPIRSETCWRIDGHRAWPAEGILPESAMQPITEPVMIKTSPQREHKYSTRDSVVLEYLRGMREMILNQSRVLLQYLSANPQQREYADRPADRDQVPPATKQTQPMVDEQSQAEQERRLDIGKSLMEIVSARTGYPAETLDLNLDLAADLSIDSIKRAEIFGELRKRLGLQNQDAAEQEQMIEELYRQKTLKDVIFWLEKRIEDFTNSLVPEKFSPAEQIVSPSKILLDIVSSNTGYPLERLDLDLDLVADLSIKRIKRIEIVGELLKKLGIADQEPNKQGEFVEQLSSRKTLRAIIDWLRDFQESSSAMVDISTPEIVEKHNTEQNLRVPKSVRRYILSVETAPSVSFNDLSSEGMRFAITYDGIGVAQALSRFLQSKGACASTQILYASETLPPTDGLIVLDGLSPRMDGESIKRIFSLAQQALAQEVKWIYAATGLGGNFGRSTQETPICIQGGVSGLFKTVAKESTNSKVLVIDFDSSDSVESIAKSIFQELLAHDTLVEVGYKNGVRHLLQPVQTKKQTTEVKSGDLNSLDLNRDSVILLTGGARGITGEVACGLAQKYQPHLVLVGRSQAPANNDLLPEVNEAKDLRDLRRTLISLYPDNGPAQINMLANRLLAAREIRHNLLKMEKAGARVEYHAVDVRDRAKFRALIENLYNKYSRIDGVIHGAGVIEDKLIRDKSISSFSRVFDTKVSGALTIAETIRDDVRFMFFFSSISAVFGNRGQVDYAAANDVLDKLALTLNRRIRGRVASINWGPWEPSSHGPSMVSRELEEEYARAGIGVIPVSDGVKSFITELNSPSKDAQVIWMQASPMCFL